MQREELKKAILWLNRITGIEFTVIIPRSWFDFSLVMYIFKHLRLTLCISELIYILTISISILIIYNYVKGVQV